jgi:hypothetical protein
VASGSSGFQRDQGIRNAHRSLKSKARLVVPGALFAFDLPGRDAITLCPAALMEEVGSRSLSTTAHSRTSLAWSARRAGPRGPKGCRLPPTVRSRPSLRRRADAINLLSCATDRANNQLSANIRGRSPCAPQREQRLRDWYRIPKAATEQNRSHGPDHPDDCS